MSDDTEKRAPLEEQPIQLAIAEELGVLPEADRRHNPFETATDAVPTEPSDDGSEVELARRDAGVGLYRDNATTPTEKQNQHTPKDTP